jgi:hypothetical protein
MAKKNKPQYQRREQARLERKAHREKEAIVWAEDFFKRVDAEEKWNGAYELLFSPGQFGEIVAYLGAPSCEAVFYAFQMWNNLTKHAHSSAHPFINEPEAPT